MARVPQLLDVSVPLSSALPTYPGHPPFLLEPMTRIADGAPARVVRKR